MRFLPVSVAITIAATNAFAQTRHEVYETPQVKPPAWLTAKWTYDDKNFRAIRNQVEALWITGRATDDEIRLLFVKNVGPHAQAIRDSQYTRKAPPEKPFFWLVALSAYFYETRVRTEWEGKCGTHILLETISIPASYEFTRVAFCYYVKEATSRASINPELATRLLTRSPKDPLVRLYAVHMGNGMNGDGPWQRRAQILAEELYREYPKHYRSFRRLLESTSYLSWKRTKDSKYIRRVIALVDEALRSNDPYYVQYRQHTQFVRKMYVDEAKKAGIKID